MVHAGLVVDNALGQRVFQAYKVHLVVNHGHLAVEGHRKRDGFGTLFLVFALGGHHGASGHTGNCARFDLGTHGNHGTAGNGAGFNVQPTGLQGIQQQVLHLRLGVNLLDGVGNLFCLFWVAGVELQQAVTTLLDFLAHLFGIFLNRGNDLGHKVFHAVQRIRQGFNQAVRVLEEQLATAHQGRAKGVQAFVVPAEHHLLARAFHVGHMHVDVLGLADTVQASDALFY